MARSIPRDPLTIPKVAAAVALLGRPFGVGGVVGRAGRHFPGKAAAHRADPAESVADRSENRGGFHGAGRILPFFSS